MVYARIVLDPVELAHKGGVKYVAEALTQHHGARHREQHFHLRVPAFNALLKVDRDDADVGGLDDVLVELLEPLELGDLALEAGVQRCVLDGDTDVTGEGFKQLDIFA